MNKAELVTAMSNETGFTKKDTQAVLDAFQSVVTDALKGGDSVQLAGFGIFTVADRAARAGRNPQTGDPVEIPATKVPKFKAYKALKDAVNF